MVWGRGRSTPTAPGPAIAYVERPDGLALLITHPPTKTEPLTGGSTSHPHVHQQHISHRRCSRRPPSSSASTTPSPASRSVPIYIHIHVRVGVGIE